MPNNRNTKRKKVFYSSAISIGTYEEQLNNAIGWFQAIKEPNTRYATEIKQVKEWKKKEKSIEVWGNCNRFKTWRITVELVSETKVK